MDYDDMGYLSSPDDKHGISDVNHQVMQATCWAENPREDTMKCELQWQN